MPTSPIDTDELLRKLASESVKNGENLRAAVRDLTLKALQSRELSLGQIKQVLKSVTEGINLGAGGAGIDVERSLADAMAGMDDALRKAAQASQIALRQLTGAGENFEQSELKKALDELEQLEDVFLKTVRESSESAGERLKAQWAGVLKNVKVGDTGAGAQVAATMQQFEERMRVAMRQQREVSVKTAHMLSQNFATLASGVLIGLTEALQQQEDAKPPAARPPETT
jgi:hypothetical protein